MVLLALTVLGLLAVAIAWCRQLIPYSTVYGTVAEWVGAIAGWVGAIGAVSAIFWAVYVFKHQQEREARKVVTTWQTVSKEVPNPAPDGSDSERQRPRETELIATVHNFGVSPVKEVSLLLDLPSEKRGWSEVSGELSRDIPFIAPNGTDIERFGVRSEHPFGLWSLMYGEDGGLQKYTVVQYTDDHGTRWESRNGVARGSADHQQSRMNLRLAGRDQLLTSGNSPMGGET